MQSRMATHPAHWRSMSTSWSVFGRFESAETAGAASRFTPADSSIIGESGTATSSACGSAKCLSRLRLRLLLPQTDPGAEPARCGSPLSGSERKPASQPRCCTGLLLLLRPLPPPLGLPADSMGCVSPLSGCPGVSPDPGVPGLSPVPSSGFIPASLSARSASEARRFEPPACVLGASELSG